MLHPGDRVGDWIVERSLGEGGMGAVFRCHNALVDRIVAAVKVLKPHALDEARERFFREVIAVDELRHPHIVRVKGFGEDAGRGLLWMAMELVEGDDLGARIASGPTPPDAALALVRPLLDALAHAHERGIHHRDLKPSNILVTREGVPKLVDFGIATQEGLTRLTRTGMVVGTPSYMPPEVFGDDPIDPASADIFAMGQILHELLTGRETHPEDPTLSDGQRMARLLAAKLRAEALDPGPTVPAWLRAAVGRATEPDPERRFGTVGELVRALQGPQVETRWVASPVRTTPPAAAEEPARPPEASPPPSVATPPVDRRPAQGPPPRGAGSPVARVDVDDEEPRPRRLGAGGWAGLGLAGVLATLGLGVVVCGGAVAAVGFGWFTDDPASIVGVALADAPPPAVDLGPLQAPRVSGATRVPLSTFWAPADAAVLDDDVLERVGARCGEGRSVAGVLPMRVAMIAATPGRPVEIAGEPVGSLDEAGRFDASQLRRGLHTDVYEALVALAESTKGVYARTGCGSLAGGGAGGGFDGDLLLALDERLPFETAQILAYTAGQAQFDNLYAVVDDPGASDAVASPAAGAEGTRPAVVRVTADGFKLVEDTAEVTLPCTPAPCAALDAWPVGGLRRFLSGLRDSADGPTALVVAPDPGTPWGAVALAVAAGARGEGGAPLFARASLGWSGEPASATAWVPPARPTGGLRWSDDDGIAVLPLTLPRLDLTSVGRPKRVEDGPDLEKSAPLPKTGPLGGDAPAGGGDASSGSPASHVIDALGGLTGAQGTQLPSGGLGSAGGGTAGGVGTKGSGAGASGLGERAPGTPNVTGGEAAVLGSIDRAGFDAVIKRNMNQIRYCYQRELTTNPNAKGQIVVKFVIAKDGSVSSAEAKSSTLGNRTVESCVVGRFQRMQFPAPDGGGIVIVSYPITFAPG